MTEERQRDEEIRRRQQGRAVDVGVALQEVDGVVDPRYAVLPSGFQCLDGKIADCQKTRLIRGKRDQIPKVQAEIDVKAVLLTRLLSSLKRLECPGHLAVI